MRGAIFTNLQYLSLLQLLITICLLTQLSQGRYKVSTQDDCINCIDVGKNSYCRSDSNLQEGLCCNSLFDFSSQNCMESQRDCTTEVTSNYYLKYMLCPNINEKCLQAPNIKLNTTFAKTITIQPLSFTEYCYYYITTDPSLLKDFSKAIKINIINQYQANITMFANQSNPLSQPVLTPVSGELGNTYQFNLRDTVLIIVKSSSKTQDQFMDFAQFGFKVYVDSYVESMDRSKTYINGSSNSSSSSDSTTTSTTSTSTSIFDTYSVYFNRQSYRVTVIVIVYFVVVFGWMLFLLAVSCIYRHYLEKRWYPLDYRLRQDAKRVRSLKQEEDEKMLKEMQKEEHLVDGNHNTTTKPDPEDKYLNDVSHSNPDIDKIDFTPFDQNQEAKSSRSNIKNKKQTSNIKLIDIHSDEENQKMPKTNRSQKETPILSPQHLDPQTNLNSSQVPMLSMNYQQNPKFDDPDVEEIFILQQQKTNKPKKNKIKRIKTKVNEQEPQGIQIQQQSNLVQPQNTIAKVEDQQDLQQLNQQNKQNPYMSDIIMENDDQMCDQESNGKYTKISLDKISEEPSSVQSSIHMKNLKVSKQKSMRNTGKSNFSNNAKSEILANDSQLDFDQESRQKSNKQPLRQDIIEEEEELSPRDNEFNNINIEIHSPKEDGQGQNKSIKAQLESPKSNKSQNNVNLNPNDLFKLKSVKPRRTGDKFKEAKVVPLL
eukprot:403368934